MSFWDDMAKEVPEESQAFEDFPEKVWALARPANRDDGGWAPKLREITLRDGSGSFFVFSHGLQPFGAELSKVNEANKKSWIPFSPPCSTKEGALNGRIVGYLNAIFAAGVKDKGERWAKTLDALKEASEEVEGSPEAYPDQGTYLCACAVKALQDIDEDVRVLVKTRMGKGSKPRVEGGTIEDATPENIQKRGVAEYADDEAPF